MRVSLEGWSFEAVRLRQLHLFQILRHVHLDNMVSLRFRLLRRLSRLVYPRFLMVLESSWLALAFRLIPPLFVSTRSEGYKKVQ